jgi:hypothetical protein
LPTVVEAAEGPAMTDQYIPGTCNIGSEEIALRRRAGHVGLAATAALATVLIRSDLHPAWRLTLALPAAGAASGYLQARQRFCANFGVTVAGNARMSAMPAGTGPRPPSGVHPSGSVVRDGGVQPSGVQPVRCPGS